MKGLFATAATLLVLTIFYCANTAANTIQFQDYFQNQIELEHDSSDLLNQGSEINDFVRQDLLPSYFRAFLSRIEEDPTVFDQVFADVSNQCRNHTTAWMQSFSNLTLLFGKNSWALHMIDSWSKIPEGILSGHTATWGDFDECLAVRGEVEVENGETEIFKGKYCANMLLPLIDGIGLTEESDISSVGGLPTNMMQLILLLPRMGSCYPSSCSNQDVFVLLNRTLSFIPFVKFLPTVTYCTTDDPIELRDGDVAMAAILSVILALSVASTFLDVTLDPKSSNRNGYGVQALLAFSVYTNTKKWLNTKGGGGGENFGCIHGIRFLSTCWVVLAHQWAQLLSNTWNMVEVGQLYKSNWTIFSIINATVSVDTFFTMSGLLFSYNMLKMLNKSKGKVNIPMMYIHRYLRLTPTYALLVGLVATFYAHLGNGPQWNSVLMQSASCRNNWWHNLLYFNNLVDYNVNDPEFGMCHGEAWYLANDMQFFLISPFLIYPLFKWEKFGMVLLSLFSAASIATPWVVHSTYEPTLLPTPLPTRSMEINAVTYRRPWMRFGPYAVGLWAGFLLYKTANKKLKLSKLVVLVGWMLSTGTALAIIYGIIPWFNPDTEIPHALGAFYAGTHRFAWGIVIAWIIFACSRGWLTPISKSRGYGGPVNAFLSWKAFIPLGRLTFCVYLISLTLQMAYTARTLQSVTYDSYVTTNLFFSQLVTSLLVSFVCCITMESPFIALEKLLFQGPTKVAPERKTPEPEAVTSKPDV